MKRLKQFVLTLTALAQAHSKALALVFFGMFLFYQLAEFLSGSLVGVDHGFFGEVSYNLAFRGNLAMPSWAGILDLDQYTYWMTPAGFGVQAAFYRVFGFGLAQTQLYPFVISLLLLAVTYLFARDLFGKRVAWLSVLLLLANMLFYVASVQNRPDMLMSLLGASSLLLFWKYIKSDKLRFLAAAVFLGTLAALTHVLGLFFLISIYLYLLINSKACIRQAFAAIAKTSLFFVVPMLLYLAYVLQSPDTLISQYEFNAGGPKLLQGLILEIKLRYPRLLLFLPFFTAGFVLSLIYSFRRRREKENAFFFTTAVTWLLISAFADPQHDELVHFIYIFPLAAIFMARMFVEYSKRAAYSLLLLALLSHIFVISGWLGLSNWPSPLNPGFRQVSDQLRAEVGDASVVAPQEYFLVFPENYRSMTAVFTVKDIEGGNVGDIIEETRPTYIVYSENLKRRYTRNLPQYQQELDEYLAAKYRLVTQITKRKIPFGSFSRDNFDVYLYQRVES